MRFLATRIAALRILSDLPILDVGSGTGIFTRQLAAHLPAESRLVGIEPSTKMREQAEADTHYPSILYRDGAAEHLPVNNASTRAVVAATAAHWFERSSFYSEARRVLVAGGLLCIIEYVRDEASSAAARAVVQFLRQYGESRAYERPHYVAEMRALEGFGPVETFQQAVVFLLSADQFSGLALSSSHARQAVETLGPTQADAMLKAIGADLADDGGGKIPFGYLFQAFVTMRR
jgi:ubiquinone/menaquinone biosynthesis C-methylase UbiE